MKPNIVVFFSDDHAAWALPSAGNREIAAPHLSALAATGALMENAFTPCPVCSPARASFWTGLYPSQHGVHDHLAEDDANVAATPWLQDLPTLAEYLSAVGYQSAMCGKWHCGAGEKPKAGFDYWYSSWRKTPKYDKMTQKYSDQGQVLQRTGYDTQIITDAAIDFLCQRARQDDEAQPFFLFIGYATTHNPWVNRDERLVARYRGATFEDIPADSPYAFGAAGSHPPPPADAADAKEALAQYYASVTMIDEAVGRVLDTLAALKQCDDTLIVYTSDHGLNMGHHGLWGKGNGSEPLNMLEESIRVPLILNYARMIPGGQRRAELVNHCDLFRTLLDFAGAAAHAPQRSPGRSYRRLLQGAGDGAWRNQTVVEYGPVRALREQNYKLVQRHDGHPHLLHDLQKDPRETVNLYSDKRYQDLRRRMTADLDTFFARYEAPERSGLRGDALPIHNRREIWRSRRQKTTPTPTATSTATLTKERRK